MVSGALRSAEHLHRRPWRRVPNSAGQSARTQLACRRIRSVTGRDDADLRHLAFPACGAAQRRSTSYWRREPAICDQSALRPAGSAFSPSASTSSPCSAPGYFVRAKLQRDVALSHPGDGHPGHGDDPRPIQSVCVPRDCLDRHLRAAQPAATRPRRCRRPSNT